MKRRIYADWIAEEVISELLPCHPQSLNRSITVQLVSSYTSLYSTASLPINHKIFSCFVKSSLVKWYDQPYSDPSLNGECSLTTLLLYSLGWGGSYHIIEWPFPKPWKQKYEINRDNTSFHLCNVVIEKVTLDVRLWTAIRNASFLSGHKFVLKISFYDRAQLEFVVLGPMWNIRPDCLQVCVALYLTISIFQQIGANLVQQCNTFFVIWNIKTV